MRGSGWATDWPRAVRGLHELTHAADHPLRKGVSLIFLPAQEKQGVERNALTKSGQKWKGGRVGGMAIFAAAACCAAPLRLATLAFVEQRSKQPSDGAVGPRGDLSIKGSQEII